MVRKPEKADGHNNNVQFPSLPNTYIYTAFDELSHMGYCDLLEIENIFLWNTNWYLIYKRVQIAMNFLVVI